MQKTMIRLSNTGLKYKVYGNRKSEDGAFMKGKDMRVFVDTGANVNSMSRRQFLAFLDANLDPDFIKGPMGGLKVKFVGEQTLLVASDKVWIQTEVSTTKGKESFLF